ncbi:glucuronate isomerase [Bacillus horti]|uniref:Uronate isomerase n=1 Tax=Caldalkalibacillus horti TaxID=77523 RepID=A0ABT9VZA6_9BACI|nr:glucuronate isomerase [Bacillus horti]MDQ0166190.1 glucuronate isomerase [Bacillus horti]
MKAFLDDHFLLGTKTAETLYHQFAKDMPIFDYHCHLSAKEIAENKAFSDLTDIWLKDDHYKWRLMRSHGVDEKWITGEAPAKEKYLKWVDTVQYALGNPLYHWTHLELQRYFGITDPLTMQTAEQVWTTCNQLLQSEDFRPQELMKRSNVRTICTTDDPLDSLEYHKQLKEQPNFEIEVLPTFRPDGALMIENKEFNQWIEELESLTETSITSLEDLVAGLEERVVYFHEVGCRLSDHGLDSSFYLESSEAEVNEIFQKGRDGQALTREEIIQYKTGVMKALGSLYAKYDWAMQLHIGALRRVNSKMTKLAGPNTGFDSIADFTYAEDLGKLLDALDSSDSLPKTIIYNLNPRDNYMIASMIGNFQSDIPGKIQFGTAWWFNDQRDGMEDQLKVLANCGLLANFVGMLTDSRSFLSYTRHEYFRRILCNLLGAWVENGEFPADMKILEKVIRDICYNNIYAYLKTPERLENSIIGNH